MWHTPQAWIFTTASPGPGSGTTIVSTVTGWFLPRATTARTFCDIPVRPLSFTRSIGRSPDRRLPAVRPFRPTKTYR
ncbi:hypothetical protein GCM10010405_16450 [Streptomyces macrosporus]|uniref:Uncharacterized protein n=1 Tax=Streptomyces macrosporus TaxID=44032 RepID=A0ABN3JM89_9ACTN